MWFTRRQQDVIELLLERWYSNKEIANRLGVGESAIKHIVHELLLKTGTTSRYELRDWAMGVRK